MLCLPSSSRLFLCLLPELGQLSTHFVALATSTHSPCLCSPADSVSTGQPLSSNPQPKLPALPVTSYGRFPCQASFVLASGSLIPAHMHLTLRSIRLPKPTSQPVIKPCQHSSNPDDFNARHLGAISRQKGCLRGKG